MAKLQSIVLVLKMKLLSRFLNYLETYTLNIQMIDIPPPQKKKKKKKKQSNKQKPRQKKQNPKN